jgi:hypothetical protein
MKITLAGTPWADSDTTNFGWELHARSMLAHLMDAATLLEYRVLVSADVSAGVHTIYLAKPAVTTAAA